MIAAVLLGGVSIFGGRGALHGVIAGVLLIGTLASALRLANVTSDVINIITGTLLVASVVATSFLAWLRRSDGRPGGSRNGAPRSPRARTPRTSMQHRMTPRTARRTMMFSRIVDAKRRLGGRRRARGSRAALLATGCADDRRRRRRRRRDGGDANLSITFLPKNLGNAYFDTSDAGGEEAIEEFGGTYAEVGPADGHARRPGQLHQHR